MKSLKGLTLKQKKFLCEQGFKPGDFLLERVTADDYVFYNIHTKQLMEIRR
ncbi:hypothetical protein JCM1393_25080 [Clostridium carnis]